MEEISECCQKTNEFRRNLQWNDLSRKGRVISSMLFFLLYLGPSYAMSTRTNYPWHVRLLLYLPFFIISLSLLVPRLNRIPVNPHLCGLISVFICSIAVLVVTPEGLVPEWATAIAIAGLAALMTGPMLSGFDKKERERKASAEQGGEPEPPIVRDLKS